MDDQVTITQRKQSETNRKNIKVKWVYSTVQEHKTDDTVHGNEGKIDDW